MPKVSLGDILGGQSLFASDTIKGKSPVLPGLHDYVGKEKVPGPVGATPTFGKFSQEDMEKLRVVAARSGMKPYDLAAIIAWESRGDPGATNKATNATGLIQFMPSTAKALGTSTDKIRGMSVADQLDLVEKYLQMGAVKSRLKGRVPQLSDLAMSVFYPAYIGKPGNARFNDSVQRVNPGIKTVDDYVNKVKARAAQMKLDQIFGAQQ